MNKYRQALADIRQAKKKIKGLTFDEAKKVLCGFNCDSEVFDFDFGTITGTVTNKNGLATISKYTCFDIYSEDFLETGLVDHLTEKEIKERS